MADAASLDFHNARARCRTFLRSKCAQMRHPPRGCGTEVGSWRSSGCNEYPAAVNEMWALLIGGVFGLAASWGPIAFTAQRDRTRHAASTAGRFLSDCDRLMRATL